MLLRAREGGQEGWLLHSHGEPGRKENQRQPVTEDMARPKPGSQGEPRCTGARDQLIRVSPAEGRPTTPRPLVSAPVRCLCVATVFVPFLCAFWWWFLFKVAPERSAGVLSSVSKCKEAGMCLVEKLCVLEKRHLGIICSAVGRELDVNEPTVCNS